MNKRNWLCVVIGSSLLTLINAAPNDVDVAIIGSVATGEDPIPAVQKRQPAFDIKNTEHRIIKGRSITIHEVTPPPTPAVKGSPAPVRQSPQYSEEQTRKLVEKMISMRVVFLSATVYGEGLSQLTKLRIWCDDQECEVITTINFVHFTGFGGFRVEDRSYMQVVGAGIAIDSKGRVMQPAPEDLKKANRLARSGTRNRYTIVKIGADDTTSLQTLDDMVTLYEQKKEHLAAAYETRKANEKIRAARRAAAGPQPPKPITIHFWKRDVEQEQAQARQQQAAQKGGSK